MTVQKSGQASLVTRFSLFFAIRLRFFRDTIQTLSQNVTGYLTRLACVRILHMLSIMPDRRSYPAFVCPMLLASQERHTADGNLDLGPCCTVPTDLTFGVEIEIWSPKGRDELGEELRACGIDARVVWYVGS